MDNEAGEGGLAAPFEAVEAILVDARGRVLVAPAPRERAVRERDPRGMIDPIPSSLGAHFLCGVDLLFTETRREKLAESPLPCDHKIQIKNGACAHVIKWRYGFHDNSRAG